jgi:hypothetical protein
VYRPKVHINSVCWVMESCNIDFLRSSSRAHIDMYTGSDFVYLFTLYITLLIWHVPGSKLNLEETILTDAFH